MKDETNIFSQSLKRPLSEDQLIEYLSTYEITLFEVYAEDMLDGNCKIYIHAKGRPKDPDWKRKTDKKSLEIERYVKKFIKFLKREQKK